MEKVNDPVVRSALKTYLIQSGAIHSGIKVIDELAVASVNGRIDVVLVGDLLTGYEIKSDVDKLARVPKEAASYERVLDHLTFVVTKKHVPEIRKLLRPAYGLYVYEDGHIWPIRHAKAHSRRDLTAMVQLLWKEDAVELLRECAVTSGLSKLPKRTLHALLLSKCTMAQAHCALLRQYKKHRRLDDRLGSCW